MCAGAAISPLACVLYLQRKVQGQLATEKKTVLCCNFLHLYTKIHAGEIVHVSRIWSGGDPGSGRLHTEEKTS